jgi:replicative DNA helicase
VNTHRLPADLNLERDVLIACLQKPEALLTLGVSDDDFALDAHRMVWRAMLDLHEVGSPVDLVRVRSKLIDSDDLAKVGGEAFLATLNRTIPAKTLPVDRLLRMTKLRAVRAAAESVIAAAIGNDPDMASAALEAARSLDTEVLTRRPKTARELSEEWYAALSRDPNEGTVSPGLPALKRVIGRLDVGSMTLVGADVNVGKSTLALEMLMLALLDGERVGYLSMEDPERIVTERVMSVLGQMSAKQVRHFRPGQGGEERVDRAMQLMAKIGDKFQVSNCIGMNERETLEQMTMMAKSGCRLIVLDYIGVVGCSVKQQDRRNEIRWIATRFKARAVAAKVAIVVVSQFQRPKDNDSGREPTKHSFRESGDLEAMAEYAIVMWRKVEDDYAPVYCKIAKSKTGGNGYGWTMQRELESLNGGPGTGRMVEVAHDDEPVRDDMGGWVDMRPVMGDPSGKNRWTAGKSGR